MYYSIDYITEEFWGAKIKEKEFSLFEEYEGEVFDIVKDMIENDGWDTIPHEINIRADGDEGVKNFYIDPYDYLTDNQIAELNDLIMSFEI